MSVRKIKTLEEFKADLSAMSNDKIPGGKGDNKDNSNFDENELKVGTAVEMEHTQDSTLAEEIAKDHLTEDPKYYSNLVKSGIVDEPEALKLAKELLNVEPEAEPTNEGEFEMKPEDVDTLKELLKTKGSSLNDDDIHKFASDKGYNTPDVEAYIYKLAAASLNA